MRNYRWRQNEEVSARRACQALGKQDFRRPKEILKEPMCVVFRKLIEYMNFTYVRREDLKFVIITGSTGTQLLYSYVAVIRCILNADFVILSLNLQIHTIKYQKNYGWFTSIVLTYNLTF